SSTAKTEKLPFEMKAGSAADLWTTTVSGSGVSTLVIPSSRNEGLPLIAIARSSDHLTSTELSSLLVVWNLTPGRRWKVNVRASALTSQLWARSGTIWLISVSSSVTSVL